MGKREKTLTGMMLREANGWWADTAIDNGEWYWFNGVNDREPLTQDEIDVVDDRV